MYRILTSVVPQLAESVPKRISANANSIYGSYTRSSNSSYSKYVSPSQTSGPDDRDSCKQFTTLARMFNCNSPRHFGSGDKVSIVGLDDIGMAIVYTLLVKGITNNICMVDMNEDILQGEHMDIQSSALFLDNARIHSSKDLGMDVLFQMWEIQLNVEFSQKVLGEQNHEDVGLQYEYRILDPADTYNSKVCIITTGTFKGRNESEQEFITRSAGIIRAIVTPLAKHSPEAIFIVASDPVDVLTYVAWRLTNFPKEQIIGTGTLMDTARFRYLLSDKLGVAPSDCNAYIIGEHGQVNSVPVWSNVNVAGVRLVDLNPQIGLEDDPELWHEVYQDAVKTDDAVRHLKGIVTWSVGLAVAEICKAIFSNTYSVLPVSTHVKGEHAIRDDVFLSLPCVIGSQGVCNIIRQELSDQEASLLRRGAGHLMLQLESTNKIIN